MTDLLKELEAAMRWGFHGNARDFLRTHHAEIAEALKDAEIGRAYLRWYASAKGYRNVIADSAHEAITIDAMHNGAREATMRICRTTPHAPMR
jgi:hypothetical protein